MMIRGDVEAVTVQSMARLLRGFYGCLGSRDTPLQRLFQSQQIAMQGGQVACRNSKMRRRLQRKVSDLPSTSVSTS